MSPTTRHQADRTIPASDPSALLIDQVTGLVRWLRPVPSDPAAPRSLCVWSAHTADVHGVLGWPADRYGTGTAFDDDGRARAAAVGEAVERYCANLVPPSLLWASYDDLRAAGHEVLDPATLALYSANQHAEPGCPFVPFTQDLPVAWTEGHRMNDPSRRTVLVPASLTWVNYFASPTRRPEPPTNFSLLAGLAAGTSRRHAEAAALEELIERDATTIWWHSGGEPVGLDIDQPSLAARLQPPPGSAVEVSFVLVPNSFDVPVVGALLRDHDHDIVTLGVAARPSAATAVLKAAGEAWALRAYSLGLLDPDGQVWQAVEAGFFDGSPLKPHRADRTYAEAYRPDFRDMTDLACHSQYYLDPATHHLVDRIARPADRTALGQVPDVSGDPYPAYIDRIVGATGITPVAVDVTTADVAAVGLHVSRVVAPGLYSNPPAAFPFLGGFRLYTEAHRLGLTDRPLTEDAVVLAPLPHT